MSSSGERSSGKSKQPTASPPRHRELVVRVLVFGTLAILLLLAYLDFRAKRAYEQSLEVWRAELRTQQDQRLDLGLSRVRELAVGDPTEEQLEQSPTLIRYRYTWSGIFRTYAATLTFDPAVDPTLAEISAGNDAGSEEGAGSVDETGSDGTAQPAGTAGEAG